MGDALQALLHPDAVRIVQALAGRARYRYVQPRVAPAGAGWMILSPCCSRHVDDADGEITIALLEPQDPARPELGWRLHRHDPVHRRWMLCADGLPLDEAARRVAQDVLGEFWP